MDKKLVTKTLGSFDFLFLFITQVNSSNIVMWGNTAQQCRLGLFQDSDFAGDP